MHALNKLLERLRGQMPGVGFACVPKFNLYFNPPLVVMPPPRPSVAIRFHP